MKQKFLVHETVVSPTGTYPEHDTDFPKYKQSFLYYTAAGPYGLIALCDSAGRHNYIGIEAAIYLFRKIIPPAANRMQKNKHTCAQRRLRSLP